MNRKTLFTAIIVVAVVAFILDTSGLFKRRNAVASPPRLPQAVLSPLLSWAESHYQTPERYVLSALKSHDIVFIGEFSKIAQNVTLVANLIPLLYADGVRNLGIEFALRDDQARIDALLNAPSYNEAEARSITFDWIVTWGFQEYIDIYRAAWKLNRSLPAGSKPFRIVGLNVRQNWEYLKTAQDTKNEETVKKIQAFGISDAVMAEVIEREFVSKNEKALVYCSQQHAFTRYSETEYAKNAAAMHLPETRRAGNIVFDKIGARAFTVMMHAPWPDATSQNGLSYPVDGKIDALIAALPEDKRNAGFDTAGTPLGAIAVTSSMYATGHTSLTLAGVCDGYIFQGPISGYRAATPIQGFVTEADSAYAAKNFPGPKPASLAASDINQLIVDEAGAVDKMMKQFK